MMIDLPGMFESTMGIGLLTVPVKWHFKATAIAEDTEKTLEGNNS